MSFDSHVIIDEDKNKNISSIATQQRRDTHFGSTVQCTSSVVVNIQQLQSELHTQHQHEKYALTELNQRFHLFVDRVQVLQSQNLKYLAAISDLRQQLSGISGVDIQSDEDYLSIRSNLSTIHNAKIDYEWDFELFQVQIEIYQQLIAIEQQWKDKRVLILEDELKQSASVLVTLRTSYSELQRQVEHLYVEGGNLYKQYLALAHDWCNIKKQRNKWSLSVETLNSYIMFYKKVRSYSERDSTYVSIQSDDSEQYWRLELDKVVKKIRHDFNAFYTAIHREMDACCTKKIKEMEITIKEVFDEQQSETEDFSRIYEAQYTEYEKIQSSLSYEKEIFMKLEATYSKLEAEYQSIQLQYEERLETQSTELYTLQERISTIVYDVNEMRCSKDNLEAEIIVYRLLLESIGMEKKQTLVTIDTESVGSEMMGKIAIKSHKKGPVGIKECAPNGAYISLVNYSTKKDIDISRWVIIRHIDSGTKLHYTIPDGVRLERGKELRIYAKFGSTTVSRSTSHQNLVNKDLSSWSMGNKVETRLFNQNADEEASYSQSIAF